MAVATDQKLETLAINTIRTLSIDAVQKANSGHPGMPMGAAAMAYVLWTEYLKFNPKDPSWPDRDRFVLSAGHGSMLLYSLLYLTGYDLSLDDIKHFRQLGSRTPGHPERGHTPGVEVTTGPLGQGFGNGVGLAIAEAFLGARYNRPGHEIINHYTYGIVSDGDLMEGIAAEAASLAGHLQLGKLIYMYDQNQVTLAASTALDFTEDVGKRFDAYGWQTIHINGEDPDAVRSALDEARADKERPTLILCRTHLGYGSPNKQDTYQAHGSPLGVEEVKLTKENLGWPTEPDFLIPDEALRKFREAVPRGQAAEDDWQRRFDAYKQAHPELAKEIETALSGQLPKGWDADLPHFDVGSKPMATRKASEAAIQAFFPKIPTFIGGSADLNPSTNTVMQEGGDFAGPAAQPTGKHDQGTSGGVWSYAGRNIHFGVREHAMAAAVNGMAAHGGVIPYAATFLVFSDYMRPSVRLAALSHVKSIFVYTHDSIGLGEDGPTHQPVEHVMSLRAIPHLTVIRPADPNETVAAWKATLTNDGPTALVLTRQNLAVLERSGAKGDLAQGGYILVDSDGKPDIVLIGTGSEVGLCVEARQELAKHNIKARVVSLPCWELFDQQDDAYRESVLGPDGTPRLSVEAGTTLGWCRYTGSHGGSVGIDTFGASGPGEQVMAHFGFTTEHVTAEALRLLGRNDLATQIDKHQEGNVAGQEEAKGDEGHS